MTIRRILIAIVSVLLCFILQTTFFPAVSFAGIIPNLLLILTCCYGFMRGEYQGLLMGFFCGLLGDIFFRDVIGGQAILLMLIGYMNGKFAEVYYPEDIKLPLGLLIGSDLCYGIVCYNFLFLLRGRFHFSYYFTHVILPEMVYTLVVSLFLYPLILLVMTAVAKREKRSEKRFV